MQAKVLFFLILQFLFLINGILYPNVAHATEGTNPLIAVFVPPTISDMRILPTTVLPNEYVSDKMCVVASPGEYEPASFVIQANDDISDLQIEVTDLLNESNLISSENVDVRTVKCWYQAGVSKYNEGSKVLTPELLLKDDALVKVEDGNNYIKVADQYLLASQPTGGIQGIPWLPSIEEFPIKDASNIQPINIFAGSNKQIWLTFKVPNNSLSGLYTGAVNLIVEEKLVKRIVLELEVLPIDLSEPCLIYSMYYHGRLQSNGQGTISNRWKSKTQLQAELQNLVAHGITSPVVYQDWEEPSLFREYLEAMKEAEMATSPLFLYGEGSNLGYGTTSSIAELTSLTKEVAEVMKIAESEGFSDVYFYGIDEALAKYGMETLLQQRNAWQAIQKANGKVFTSGVSVGRFGDERSPGDFGFVGTVLDLLNCNGPLSSEEAQRWHSEGHKILSYSNPQAGLEKPETYRRNFGLRLWQADYDGAMDFCYQTGVTGNLWNDWRNDDRRNRAMAYPTVNGVIDTIQWEGWREGVDDVRYLTTLIETIETAKAQGRDTSSSENFIYDLKQSDLEKKDLDPSVKRSLAISWCCNRKVAPPITVHQLYIPLCTLLFR